MSGSQDGYWTPHGFMQWIPYEPDYAAIIERLRDTTPEERIAAAQRYMRRIVLGEPPYEPCSHVCPVCGRCENCCPHFALGTEHPDEDG